MTTCEALNSIRERLIFCLEGRGGVDDDKVGSLWMRALCSHSKVKNKLGDRRRHSRNFLYTIDFALTDRVGMLNPHAVKVLADIIGEYVARKAKVSKKTEDEWHRRLDEWFDLAHAISGPATLMDDVHYMLFVLLRNLEMGEISVAKDDADRIIRFLNSPVFTGSTAAPFVSVLLSTFNLSVGEDVENQREWHDTLDSCRYMLRSPPLLREGNEPWNRMSGGI